jgi:hypothetical protein
MGRDTFPRGLARSPRRPGTTIRPRYVCTVVLSRRWRRPSRHAQQAISSPRCPDGMPPGRAFAYNVLRYVDARRRTVTSPRWSPRARAGYIPVGNASGTPGFIHYWLAHFESIRSAQGAAAAASATATTATPGRLQIAPATCRELLIAYSFDRRPTLPQRVTCLAAGTGPGRALDGRRARRLGDQCGAADRKGCVVPTQAYGRVLERCSKRSGSVSPLVASGGRKSRTGA